MRTKLKNIILVNWDSKMKLKTNKTFTKRPIPKMRNQKNMD